MSIVLNKSLILNITFFLLPISFILGAAVVEILFTLFSILVFFNYKKEFFDKRIKSIIIFFLIFYVYINLNSLFISDNKSQSLTSTLPYIRFLFLILALNIFLEKNNILLKQKKYFLYITIFVIFLDSSLQYFSGKNVLGLPLVDPNSQRVSSFFGSELILGGYMSKIFPIVLSIIFFLKKKDTKRYIYELLLVSLFVSFIIFYAGERVAVFQLVLILLFVLLFLNKNIKIKKIFIVFSVIITSYLFLSDNVTKKRLIDHTLQSFTYQDIDANINSKILIYSQLHHSHIMSAYKMYLDKPLVGNGLKSFRNLCDKKKYKINNYSCTTHPHNTIMLFLSEFGLIGFFFYVMSFLYFLKNFIFFLNKSEQPNVRSLQCISVGILFFYLPIPTGAFFNNFYSYQFYFLLSFYFLYLKFYNTHIKNKKKNNNGI